MRQTWSKRGIEVDVFGLHTQKGSPAAHSPYITCGTVGQSIAAIYDLSSHIYLSGSLLGWL